MKLKRQSDLFVHRIDESEANLFKLLDNDLLPFDSIIHVQLNNVNAF